MAGTYTKLYYHIVFSTKHRRPLITPRIEHELHKYLHGTISGICGLPIEVNGAADHIHILAVLPAKIAVSDALRDIKANSSKWMNENGHLFAWQEGYAAFSVSASLVEAVTEYIHNQPEHHKKRTFEEEFLALLKKHGIAADPAQVFG